MKKDETDKVNRIWINNRHQTGINIGVCRMTWDEYRKRVREYKKKRTYWR